MNKKEQKIYDDELKKQNKPKAIIIDLEGTLSDHSGRVHYYHNKDYERYNAAFIDDPVNEEFVEELKAAVDKTDATIILCTAKKKKWHQIAATWLSNNNLMPIIDKIKYRDDLDSRPSVIVKRDMLNLIKKEYDVICAYDDRKDICDMFEENGVHTYLVESQSTTIGEHTPYTRLAAAADLFKSRNVEYGDGYKEFGKIIMSLFPDGLKIENQKDASRFAILNIMIAKFDRYCKNFHKGGHSDSLKDISVYSAMLQEVDESE